jgi:oligosaccharyltransferase complex subunit epsilon
MDAVGELREIGQSFASKYSKGTTARVKAIDSFIVFGAATALAQIIYCFLVGSFPFNSFLAGVIAAAGFCIFTVALRLQVTSPQDFHHISPERAYADFLICNIVLFFFVLTFMG